jgi:hypothetical protein
MAGRIGSLRRWSCAIACAATVAAPLEARADKFDRTLDFSIHGRGTLTGGRALGLHGIGRVPEGFGNARVVGRGVDLAPIMRANLSLDGWRFGVGVGAGGYRGTQLHYRSRSAAPITAARVWSVPIEGFFGYAFRTGERVRPFLEARGSATFFGARTYPTDVRLRGHALGVAARVGILWQLNEYFFIDAGVGRTIVGPGTWTACVGLGIPIPLSNL